MRPFAGVVLERFSNELAVFAVILHLFSNDIHWHVAHHVFDSFLVSFWEGGIGDGTVTVITSTVW